MDERKDTPIWKKEISFRKKQKPASAPEGQASAASEPAAASSSKPEKSSVWKKEIAFRSKTKPEPAAAEVVAAKPAKSSVWKKEISFGGKAKAKPAAADLVSATSAAAAVASSKPDESSVWKKELSFRRKPAAAAEVTAAKPDTGDGAAEKPAKSSVWKKEIAFGKKQKQGSADDNPVSEAAPTATASPITADSEPAKTSKWKKEIGFRRKPEEVPAEPAPTAEPVASAGEEALVPPVSPLMASPALPVVTPPVLQPVTPVPAAPAEPSTFSSYPQSPVEFDAPEPDQAPVSVDVVPYVPAAGFEASEHTPPATPAPAFEPEVGPAPVPLPTPATLPGNEPELEPAAEATQAVPPAPAEPKQKREKRGGKGDKTTHNQLVGLKIGASQIAAAQVINKGGPRIVRMARMPLERGIVVGGELREPDALAAHLKTFFRKNKLPRNCVRLGISNNRIGVRTFEVSGIEDPKQLANAVRFRAQETLPIPLDEAVLDHRILDDRIGDDGARVCRVLLVVAHRELVERYAAACRKAGLKLVGIDLEAFALLRALNDPTQPPGEDAAVVCVSIGHDRSTLAVSDGQTCEFTRVLAWGGSALDGALARVLDMTPSAVTPIKHALTLGGEGPAAGLDERHADEARRAMTAELQSFARELVASLRFYQEQANSLGIVEILITGGAAACGGLADELERLIGIPVRVADPLTRVRLQRKQQEDEGVATTSMAVAVGLGIED